MTERTTLPLCRSCRYDLTGLRVEDRCPECSEPIWSDFEQHAEAMASTAALAYLAMTFSSVGAVFLLMVDPRWAFVFGAIGTAAGISAFHHASKRGITRRHRHLPSIAIAIGASVTLTSILIAAW